MKVIVTQLRRGPCVKLIFSFAAIGSEAVYESELININNMAVIRFKFVHLDDMVNGNITFSVSWKQHESVSTEEKNTVQIHAACKQLHYMKLIRCGANWSPWKKMGSLKNSETQQTSMNASKITLIVNQVKKMTFPNLYEETEFCDFNLQLANGQASLPVHKACISLHSEVFKRMLLGEWKENTAGCVKIEGVTFETLQDLKKYMYLGHLPRNVPQLQSLLLLARYYMINDLVSDCVIDLVQIVEPQDFYSLLEFAVDNKLLELVKAIVQITSDETIQTAHDLENSKKLGLLQSENE